MRKDICSIVPSGEELLNTCHLTLYKCGGFTSDLMISFFHENNQYIDQSKISDDTLSRDDAFEECLGSGL